MDEQELAHHEREIIAALDKLILQPKEFAALAALIAAAPTCDSAADQELVKAA